MRRLPLLLLLPLLTAGLVARAESRAERNDRLLHSISAQRRNAFGVIAALYRGEAVDPAMLERQLKSVDGRPDCSDFDVSALLRLMYLYRDRLDPALARRVEATLLGFKYWIDEPGRDNMCYWSENHQLLFHQCEYLAGALLPDARFSNSGMNGREHREKGRRLLEQWLSWRERFGFSEWVSNVYYDEEMMGLLNLVDFAPDEVIRRRATLALDQIALDIALNSFRGQIRSTHGRTYEKNTMTSAADDISGAIYLLYGLRPFTSDLSRPHQSSVSLATSSYQPPAAVECIARDEGPSESYQEHGLNVLEAPAQGIPFDDLDSGMFFWGMGMYAHPRVIDLSVRMWDEYRLQGNVFFAGLPRIAIPIARRRPIGPILAHAYNAAEGAFLHDAHLYTYRTRDYQLASALDHLPGRINASSLIWSAILGPDAFVFVTHPGGSPYGLPGRWTGNGANPRVAQSKNVLVAVYNAPVLPAIAETPRLFYTHAWMPRAAMDEVRHRGHWFFARKGEGYLGLYSWRAPRLRPGSNEIVAPGLFNVWICEMGSQAESGGFDRFIERLLAAPVRVRNRAVEYESPSRGRVEFGWQGPFRVAGAKVPLRRSMRFDTPWLRAPRFGQRLQIECGGRSATLDLSAGSREER